MSPASTSTRAVKKQGVTPEDCVSADDLKTHEIATACERWHMGDPLAALAATLNTNAKQLALAFLLAGCTPDRVGIGVRTGRWGRVDLEGDASAKGKPKADTNGKAQPVADLPVDSPFRYDLRPQRPMVPYVLFGEGIKPFSADSVTTKVDDLHRAALPLEYIRALTGADEKLVRTRASVLKRQGVRHMLLTLADLDRDPLAWVACITAGEQATGSGRAEPAKMRPGTPRWMELGSDG